MKKLKLRIPILLFLAGILFGCTQNIKDAEISLLKTQVEAIERQTRLFESHYRVLKDIIDPIAKNYSIEYPINDAKLDTDNNSKNLSKSNNLKIREKK